MIRLRTLGALELRDADGVELGMVLAQPKRLAVLAYLAVARPRGFHRRDSLLALFWPESDQERARAALNQAVYYLRRALGEGILINRADDELAVDPERLWCDAAAFEQAVDAGEARTALEFYRGDLLPGFFLQAVPSWEQWLEEERARLRRRAADVAGSLADRSEAAGRGAEAVAWARRAVELAPDDEVRIRRLIARLDAVGDRAGAVRVYEEAAGRLDRDYGISLSAETEAFVQRVRTRGATAPMTTRPVAGGSGRAGPPALTAMQPARRRRAAGAGLAVVLMVLLGGWFLLRPPSPRAGGVEPGSGAGRLAVLPLVDMSADARDPHLADGMTQELIARLSRIAGLRVIARTSVMPYRDGEQRASEIGRALNVGFLLEGSVRQVGDRLRITLQLVNAETEEHVWAERYDALAGDALDIQGRIAEQVARALSVGLLPGERRRLTGGGPEDPEARRAYLRGRYLLARRDAASFQAARDQFRRALDRDPTYAPAWSGLSDAYDHLAGVGALASSEAYPRARAAAERALELDPDLGEAHASLAMALTSYDWDTDRAERHFRRALELEPSNARARRTYAGHLRNQGRFDEALEQASVAADLDPLPFFSHFELIVVPYVQGRYVEAVARAESLAALDPAYGYAHFLRALALVQQEQYADALAALAAADPQNAITEARALRAHILARIGNLQAATDELRRGTLAGFERAVIHLGQGDQDAAFRALEEAYRDRDFRLRMLGVEPLFAPLRSDPRFDDLLRRVGLRP